MHTLEEVLLKDLKASNLFKIEMKSDSTLKRRLVSIKKIKVEINGQSKLIVMMRDISESYDLKKN